jgi:hypothetical protein
MARHKLCPHNDVLTAFSPQGCPEEHLTAEALCQGYRWLPAGLGVTESAEPLLSMTAQTSCWQGEGPNNIRQARAALLAWQGGAACVLHKHWWAGPLPGVLPEHGSSSACD